MFDLAAKMTQKVDWCRFLAAAQCRASLMAAWASLCAVVCVVLQGLEAILRVRCSSGLDVDGYTGSFYKPPNSPTDLYLPAIDCDKALVAKLEIMEKLPANSEVRAGHSLEGPCMAVVAVVSEHHKGTTRAYVQLQEGYLRPPAGS